MCVLRPAITEKETLIQALKDAEIDKVYVLEDIIDGTPVTSYIRGNGFGTYNHTVAILSKAKQKYKNGL